jgi:NADH-quinone oxidoreductase subunit J
MQPLGSIWKRYDMPSSLLSAVPATVHLWPIVVPALLGGIAIYLLLPRPGAPRPLRPALLGVGGLILAGFLITSATIGSASAVPEAILFYAFSFIAIVSGALLVTQRNPARAALSFALVVLSTCGLFLLLAAPFLMAATVIIYAGAIIVTFLFVLMLAQQAGLSDADARSREPLLSTITGFVLLCALLYVLQASYGTQDIDRLLERTRRAQSHETPTEIIKDVGEPEKPDTFLLAQYDRYFEAHGWTDLHKKALDLQVDWLAELAGNEPAAMKKSLAQAEVLGAEARTRLASLQPSDRLPLSDQSGPPSSIPPEDLRRDPSGRPQLPADNPAYLGRSLFTDYLLPVELGGTLLLVATVGAIAIAHRRT